MTDINNRPFTHTLMYGEAGAGKSTAAATWPKSMVVMLFDPWGKDTPYLRHGQPGAIQTVQWGMDVLSYRDVTDAEGRLIIRIEAFHDKDAHQPEAYSRFLRRMTVFHTEVDSWSTVVLDSITFMELAARKDAQYRLNPHTREPRQWYSHATEALEEMLMMQFGALATNVVALAHVDKDTDEVHGYVVRNPSAPGRLRGRLAAAYGEFYRAYVQRDDKGAISYALQTQGDGWYNAATRIGAPDPCAPSYDAVWGVHPAPAKPARRKPSTVAERHTPGGNS